MGSNIHIVHGDKNLPLADYHEGPTLPRYYNSYEFIKLVRGDCESILVCRCGDEHDYFCDYPLKFRPKDFNKLRQAATDDPWVKELIDYLESEPNAYLEYD